MVYDRQRLNKMVYHSLRTVMVVSGGIKWSKVA